jgi:hypothetical protein
LARGAPTWPSPRLGLARALPRCDLAYTPMFNARIFAEQVRLRVTGEGQGLGLGVRGSG